MMAIDAFKVSLNVPAVDLSLRLGREKLLEMTQRLGVEGVKKTCSMALGDTGITPLQHTAAYATFANGGKLTRPYAILELFNSKGDLVYSRERDEAEAPQVISRKVAENMNIMMKAVVNEGTAKRGGAGLHLRRRQDRHQLELPRRLVPRFHRRAGDGRVGRLRRLPADVVERLGRHRRQLAGHHLAQLHVGGAQQHRSSFRRSQACRCIPTRWPSSSGFRN